MLGDERNQDGFGVNWYDFDVNLIKPGVEKRAVLFRGCGVSNLIESKSNFRISSTEEKFDVGRNLKENLEF